METNPNNQPKKVEVIYDKARLSKRILAHFFDISIWLLTTLIFFTIVNSIVNVTPWSKSKANELTTLKNDTGLYVNDVVITSYVEGENEFTSTEQKKDYLKNAIDTFYANTTYFSDTKHIEQYDARRLVATKEGINLFIKDENQIKENDVLPAYLLEFYKTEVDDHCLGYLFNNSKYFYLTRFEFLKAVVEVVITATLFFFVYYLIFPLTFMKRGRQTLGMKVSKIALINVRALNVENSRYIGRFFFNLIVFFYINFFSFLLPSFVSIGMMFLSKTNQSLTNYVFNDYFVDISNQHIYLDEGERQFSIEKRKEVSIENKDFIIR